MGAGKRLAYYIEKQGFTKRKFCDKYSFEYNNMTSIMSEKRIIGINILNNIHFAFPKLNVHWLLYGEGPEEITEDEHHILNEPAEMYVKNNDAFEFMLLKYLENDKIKKKIYEIIQQKNT
jgi:transcriptional regulator with XRE-family HTH domain